MRRRSGGQLTVRVRCRNLRNQLAVVMIGQRQGIFGSAGNRSTVAAQGIGLVTLLQASGGLRRNLLSIHMMADTVDLHVLESEGIGASSRLGIMGGYIPRIVG